MKDRHSFLCKAWKVITRLIRPFVVRRFNLTSEKINVEGPCIVISNHVCDYDPLLLSQSFPDKQLYFVASEHIFRLGFVSRLLEYFLAPIPKRKASLGTDTVMSCLRHLKAGHSVCIFAEGDASWDGLTHRVFPATGKLVRNSGASLITYKLEGAYLSRPRWRTKISRGKVYGHMVRVYSPEELKAMKPEEITEAINSDIYEDAWARQKEEQTVYNCPNPADNIEQALFMCPKCAKVGTVSGSGKRVFCTACGFETFFDELCFFDPPEPFENIAQWDKWQHENIIPNEEITGVLFGDDDLTLNEISGDHSETALCTGRLCAYTDRMEICDHSFTLSDISMMAMVQKKSLLFSHCSKYYEVKASRVLCLRKYLALYNRTKNN
ncbi:MAG: lysophospholipid acyltransferase family protein [Eubacteriales bacterium]|nr:lysophospholipid acyltransferase family protein [Eubacteriales bacterium]